MIAFPVLLVSLALGQSAEADFNELRNNYEFGKDDVVLRLAEAQISREKEKETPSSTHLISLYQYAGVAAFNLNRKSQAETFFVQLLHLDPDFGLDPFVYPPPAVAYLEKLKRENAKMLEALRLARKEAEVKRQREAEERELQEREKRVRDEEEQRRRLEELARGSTLTRVVERKSFALNFVPFGVGQFQQGRTGLGVFLAASEGAFAATSIVGYFAIDALIDKKRTLTVSDRVGNTDQPISVPNPGIPRNREGERNAWRAVKIGAGVAFYATYAVGVIDAILRHQDEVVTTIEAGPPAASRAPSPPPRPFVFATPDGAGGGVTLTF